MKDIQVQLEKLRTEAANCELIAKLATEPTKRDAFAKLAVRYTGLADELARALSPTVGTT